MNISENIDYFADAAEIDIRHIEKHADEDFGRHLEQYTSLVVKRCAEIVVKNGFFKNFEGEVFDASKEEIAEMLPRLFGVR